MCLSHSGGLWHSGGRRGGGASDDQCVVAAALATVHRAGGDRMSGTTPFDCPRCGVGLAMSERQGIEIDYCPQCRGVWLDRGELDKIIARAEVVQAPPAGQPAMGQPPMGDRKSTRLNSSHA